MGDVQQSLVMEGRENFEGADTDLVAGPGNVQSVIAVSRPGHRTTMDDILELPSADVSKLQDRGQSEGPEDGDSSADEDEGGLDWTKLPYVFQLHPSHAI